MTAAAIPTAAAELRRGTSSVCVAVGPGAPITSYITNGHEWCSAGPWQDAAPSASACALPTFVSGASGAAFPSGGLLAAIEPTVDVEADGASGTITSWWAPNPYPLGWTRVITLDADGALCVKYTVTNAQQARLPFVWSMPVTLPWSTGVSIDIPRGARSRVATALGERMAMAGSEFAWPALRDGGRLVDLAQPVRLDSGRAALCFVELPRGRFVVRDGSAALEVSGTPGAVTHASVWIDNDGARPDAPARRWWRRHDTRRALAVGASLGAPGSLSEAVGAWRAAKWVEPGETMRWDMRYRLLPPAVA